MATSDASSPRWFRTAGGARGRLARVVAEALQGVPDPSGSQRIAGELARDMADAADSARTRQDLSAYLRASSRLEQLLVRAGVGPAVVAGERAPGGSGPADAGVPDELESVLGAGPEVGDSQEP